MKISTWKDSTGTFVSAITSIGTYYPIGPLGSYRLSASMASAGQTAKLEVVTLTGENKGFLEISVSGTASSFAISTPGNVAILNSDIGIKVSAISGTVTLLMDDGRGIVIKNEYAEASLVEILSATKIPTGIRARPFDIAGCTLEMGADGKWVGTLGSLSKATADALYSSGALANLATGATYRSTSGTQYTYSAGAGWGRSSKITIQAPLRMGTVGDSTAMVSSTNRLDFEALAPLTPDAGTVTVVSYQAMGAMSLLRRGRRLVAQGGIGGQGTSAMLARSGSAWQFTSATSTANAGATSIAVSAIPWALTIGTQLQFGSVIVTLTAVANENATSLSVSAISGTILSGTTGGSVGMRRSLGDVYAKNIHAVCLRAGSINNLKTATSTTVAAVVAANVADHKLIAEFYTSRGVHVIDTGTFGYLQTSNPNYKYILQAIVQSNTQTKALAENNPLWHFIDVTGHLSDETGAYFPECTDDLVHLSNYGAWALDSLESDKIDSIFDIVQDSSGAVLFDQQPNFYQQVSNLPKNCLDMTSGNITVSDKVCTSEKYTCKLTVADSTAPMYNFFFFTNLPSDMLANVKAGDHYTIDLDYTIKDSDGNFVSGPGWKEGFTYTQKTNGTTGLTYEIAYGQIPNAPRSIPCYSPVDGITLDGSTAIRMGLYFPTPGVYTFELRPITLRKFIPLTTIGQTQL